MLKPEKHVDDDLMAASSDPTDHGLITALSDPTNHELITALSDPTEVTHDSHKKVKRIPKTES